MSKVIGNCFGFGLIRSVIGLQNLRYCLNQSEVKPKKALFLLPEFSRAWRWLQVFASSSDWRIWKFLFVVIG